MIVRVKNSLMVKSREVIVENTKINLQIAKVLKSEGFIDNYEECGQIYMSNNGFVYSHIKLFLINSTCLLLNSIGKIFLTLFILLNSMIKKF